MPGESAAARSRHTELVDDFSPQHETFAQIAPSWAEMREMVNRFADLARQEEMRRKLDNAARMHQQLSADIHERARNIVASTHDSITVEMPLSAADEYVRSILDQKLALAMDTSKMRDVPFNLSVSNANWAFESWNLLAGDNAAFDEKMARMARHARSVRLDQEPAENECAETEACENDG